MEDDLDKKNESDVDIENMLQVTPVTSIKKQRKRKCEQTDLDEDNSIDIKKEFEKNGIFYYWTFNIYLHSCIFLYYRINSVQLNINWFFFFFIFFRIFRFLDR
jgi:hypothetical protein